ncbi:HigA family addiction module antitoxin [Kushneria aurantia]|uniref:HigA family addiction module antitoxin n=1 Tax=Kushneria aurantia TaxID=504092 RepID=A0ABV6G2B8_9GAMM|nr:HigA family addiction module antitoxin [Kushneria aurantia]
MQTRDQTAPSAISADMALRLAQALNTSAEMWLEMQLKYELWQAAQRPRTPVAPLHTSR